MTFSRIRCLSGHLVGWILDPPYRKPVEATSIMRLIKGLFKFGLRLLVDRGSRLSSNRSLLSSSDLVKKCSYPEFWLLTLNKMVTRPWSHFKFNLFGDSVTSTTINLVDCILSQYFVTLLIRIKFRARILVVKIKILIIEFFDESDDAGARIFFKYSSRPSD